MTIINITMTIFILLFMTPKSLSSTSTEPLILPLKLEKIPPNYNKYNNYHYYKESFISSTNELSLRHNVTLTVTLTVGTPPQSVTMVLDTGSELSWLNCGDPNPTRTRNSIFDPKSSSSYVPVACSTLTCRTRTRDLPIPVSCDPTRLCHVILSYADSTSLEGTLSSETFRIGSETRAGTLFGCMGAATWSSDPEEDAKTTGLLGLNRGSMSFAAQLSLPRFSYCISGADETGVLVLGGSGRPAAAALRYTPLVRISTPLPYYDRVAYTVQLEGITVDGKLLPIAKEVLAPDHTGAGQTMVDSGTQFTFLLGAAYNALKAEFARRTEEGGGGGGGGGVRRESGLVYQGGMDLCYRVEAGRGGVFPAVGLVFGGGAEMVVPAERTVVRVPGAEAVYCMSFGNADLIGMEAYVIGHHHQHNLWMEFDLVNSRLGFSYFDCHLATQSKPWLD